MKPPNGRHRLSPVPPKPGTSMDVVVDDTGCDTPYGRMPWYDPPGFFKRPGDPLFGLVFDTATTGRYFLGADEGPFTYESV